jgi:hypothetical protein
VFIETQYVNNEEGYIEKGNKHYIEREGNIKEEVAYCTIQRYMDKREKHSKI